MDYENTKGRIFNIQRFSIHDGPGIRTIIFLKGCMLRCKWCCNPESQEYEIQSMKSRVESQGENIQIEMKEVGEDITAKKVLDIVERDRPYYRRSDGGVTLSGGECLFQPEFTKAILQGAKEKGISTAIESTGATKYEIIESILPYLDYFLMDIKHIDSKKHQEFTGKANELMLENARKIAESGKTKLVIRVPVVPTFNDTEEEIRAIATFASKLPGVKNIHLLPYHRLGQDKYEGLGREYLMKGITPPAKEKMEILKEVGKKASGLDVQIGG